MSAIAYKRDGWGRVSPLIVSARRGEWRSQSGGAFKYAQDSRGFGYVPRAAQRGGRTVWHYLGKLEHNRHAFADLAQQFHTLASEALDDSNWTRDIIKLGGLTHAQRI